MPGLSSAAGWGDEQAHVVGHDAPAVSVGVLAASCNGRDAGDLRVELDAGQGRERGLGHLADRDPRDVNLVDLDLDRHLREVGDLDEAAGVCGGVGRGADLRVHDHDRAALWRAHRALLGVRDGDAVGLLGVGEGVVGLLNIELCSIDGVDASLTFGLAFFVRFRPFAVVVPGIGIGCFFSLNAELSVAHAHLCVADGLVQLVVLHGKEHVAFLDGVSLRDVHGLDSAADLGVHDDGGHGLGRAGGLDRLGEVAPVDEGCHELGRIVAPGVPRELGDAPRDGAHEHDCADDAARDQLLAPARAAMTHEALHGKAGLHVLVGLAEGPVRAQYLQRFLIIVGGVLICAGYPDVVHDGPPRYRVLMGKAYFRRPRRGMLSARLRAARGRHGAMNGISYKNITVVFEDEYLLAASKPADLLVHGDGTGSLTLTDLVAEHLAAEGRGDVHPQAVQRLDVETTGLVLFSLDPATQPALDAEVAGRDMRKEYLAVVAGRFPWAQKAIDAPIGRDRHDAKKMRVCKEGQGKPASTLVRKLAFKGGRTLLSVELLSGRRHQIRVHLTSLGFPIVGDELYGGVRPDAARGESGLLLHAFREELRHPATGEPLSLQTEWPERLGKNWEPTA